MKRMELKITLTFAIMFVVSFIINGIHSVITMESNFFTFEVTANALIAAIVYLGYIWINSRRHQLLTLIGVLAICFLVIFIEFSSEGVAGSFSGWDWKATVMCFYYIIAFQIAKYQGEKLIEEDKKTINITINLKGDLIKPEDIEATID